MPEISGKPLKILYIGWANHVHFQRWVEYFAAAGHGAWVLPCAPGEVKGARILPFITSNKRTSFQKIELKFYSVLLRFDLVHVHWAGFAYLPFIADLKPYVVTAWGSDIYKISDYDAESQDRIKKSLKHAALVTVDSEDQKVALVNMGVAASNVKVVQWGVDTTVFKPCLKDNALARQLGVAGRPVIYSPRNLAPIYNNDVILRAIKELINKFPDVILVQKHYNCSQDKIDEFLAIAEQLGIRKNVMLLGNMDYEQLPMIYSLADAVVSVPSSDGTPMSVLEAMSCGVVPVVSDLPSLREWIQDGYNGLFVPIGDHIQLANQLASVLERPEWSDSVKKRNCGLVMERADHFSNMRQMEEYCREVAACK